MKTIKLSNIYYKELRKARTIRSNKKSATINVAVSTGAQVIHLVS